MKGWVKLAVPELALARDIFPAAEAHTAFDEVTHRAAAAVSRLAQAILTAPRSPDKVGLLFVVMPKGHGRPPGCKSPHRL